MNEFLARNGLIALDSSSIFGPLTVSGSILFSGSLRSTGDTVIVGSTSGSATNSLLVQNSIGTNTFAVRGDGAAIFRPSVTNGSADAIVIQSAVGSTVGYIRNNGVVQFNDNVTVGYLSGIGGNLVSLSNLILGTSFVQTPSAKLHVRGTNSTLFLVQNDTPDNLFNVSSSGVVAIGMTGSAYGSTGTSNGKLTINNTSGNNGLAIRNGETGYQVAIKATTNDNIGTEFVWYDGLTATFLQYAGSIGARLGASGVAQFRSNNSDSSATIHTGGSISERLRVTSTGLVGINTTSPTYTLDVSGSARVGDSNYYLTLTNGGSDGGILRVGGSAYGYAELKSYALTLNGGHFIYGTGGSSGFGFNSQVAPGATQGAASAAMLFTADNSGSGGGTWAAYPTALAFNFRKKETSGLYTSLLVLNGNTNNVGIGTITPNAKLDVSGSAIISGSLTATQGITGSLFGTSSWSDNATSASHASNGGVTQIVAGTNVTISPTNGLGVVTINSSGGGGAAFPYTGSAIITGSLNVTGSVNITGSLLLNGSPVVTGQIILTAGGGWPSITSGSNAPVLAETATNRVNYYYLGFPDTIQTFANWSMAMPSDYNGGTITAVFYWAAGTASTNSVEWGLAARAFADGDALDQAFGTPQEVTDANQALDDVNISAATPAITIGGTPAAGNFVQFRAYRNPGDANDNLAATAELLSIRITYTRA